MPPTPHTPWHTSPSNINHADRSECSWGEMNLFLLTAVGDNWQLVHGQVQCTTLHHRTLPINSNSTSTPGSLRSELQHKTASKQCTFLLTGESTYYVIRMSIHSIYISPHVCINTTKIVNFVRRASSSPLLLTVAKPLLYVVEAHTWLPSRWE